MAQAAEQYLRFMTSFRASLDTLLGVYRRVLSSVDGPFLFSVKEDRYPRCWKKIFMLFVGWLAYSQLAKLGKDKDLGLHRIP
jgi:hypothetical protein